MNKNADNQFYQSMMSNLQNQDCGFITGDSPQSKIIAKTITENGEYFASADGADGYSKVTVDVDGGGPSPTPETFEVEMILTDMEVSSSSKTYAEVISALNDGKILSVSLDTGEVVLSSDGYVEVDGSIMIVSHLPEPYNAYIVIIFWNNPQAYTKEFMSGTTARV